MSGTSSVELLSGALDLAKPIVETGCDLVKDLLGQPCKVAGGMLSDQIYAWQWGNRLRILAKAKRKMDENEDAAKVLPPGFFLPFLEGAGNVEGEDIEELWANLLANSLSIPEARHPMVLNVLKQLSGEDAQQLRALLKREDEDVRQNGSITPMVVSEMNATVARLLGLGLIYKTPVFVGPAPPKGGQASIVVSGFGRVFLSLVEAPRRSPDSGAVSSGAEHDA